MTIGYAITLAFAVGLTVAYFAIVKKREFWLSLLYVCVTVVNLGYLLLSASKTVEFAILANDVAYLGSVFLFLYWMMQDYVHVNDIPQYTPAQGERLGVEITALSMEAKLGKVLSFVMEGEPLTIREREILELILGNKKRKEIADDLHLSENTVKTYTRTLYAKLNVTCREELFALLQN